MVFSRVSCKMIFTNGLNRIVVLKGVCSQTDVVPLPGLETVVVTLDGGECGEITLLVSPGKPSETLGRQRYNVTSLPRWDVERLPSYPTFTSVFVSVSSLRSPVGIVQHPLGPTRSSTLIFPSSEPPHLSHRRLEG